MYPAADPFAPGKSKTKSRSSAGRWKLRILEVDKRILTRTELALELRVLLSRRGVASAGKARVGPTAQRPSTRRPLTMAWIARCFRIPVSETQKTFVIAVCVVAMSIMAVGLVWQAEIIAGQRDAIRWLESAK